jgi:hypothetical protein
MELNMELEPEIIEVLLKESANKCYNILIEEGINPLISSGQDFQITMNHIISHFESQEEYLKCSQLLKIKKEYESKVR